MADDRFDRLLGSLPKIAAAINQFESPQVQERAFEALVRALGLAEAPVAAISAPSLGSSESANGEVITDTGEVDETETAATISRRKRRRLAPASVSAERDIDFMPQGKKSLQAFVAEKKPENNFERNLVAVYYLEQILNIQAITPGHVLAAYKECGWPEPGDPPNSLSATATKKHWLDTSDRKAVRTTAPGRNQVEHRMPSKKTEKT